MFGHNFYFETIRKYIIYFGTLMNDIHITREDANGNLHSVLKVPLTYAPKDKMLARISADPNLDRDTALQLPRMSFELTNLFYDGLRKLKTQGRVVKKDIANDPNKHSYQYNPVPYNLNFTLYVYVKNAEDGTKIIEQILPYFAPEWNASLNIIPELGIVKDIPIQVMSVRSEDDYEGDFSQRRALIWTIDFMMKGYLWGPIKTAPIIKFANSNFYVGSSTDINDDVGNTDPISRVTVQPGLDANGDPTTNVDISISRDLIEADDDWAYIITPTGEIINE